MGNVALRRTSRSPVDKQHDGLRRETRMEIASKSDDRQQDHAGLDP
jgi:hypothetical protein